MLAITELSPQLQEFIDGLAYEPDSVRAMWRYIVFRLMLRHDCAHILETHQDGETLHLILQTRSGQRYDVVQPPLSPEQEQTMLARLRDMIRDDGDGALTTALLGP